MFCLNCAKQIGDITKNRICPYYGYEQYKLEDVQAGIEYAKRKSKENRNRGFLRKRSWHWDYIRRMKPTK